MKWRIVTDGEAFKIQYQREVLFLKWWTDCKESRPDDSSHSGSRDYTQYFYDKHAAQNYLDSLIRKYHFTQRESRSYPWQQLKQFNYNEWKKNPKFYVWRDDV